MLETANFLFIFILSVSSLFAEEVHPCKRECKHPPQRKSCLYKFNIESYMSLSKACFDCPLNKTDCGRPHCIPLNGVKRSLMTVNRKFPGPSIEVCEGDEIVVEVENNLQNGESTSIHWHGLHVRGQPYMDGVAFLTQCPIPPFNKFVYVINATNPGTHWWHAHTAMHRSDGVFGALTIRQASEQEPNREVYDEDLSEHTILVSDWLDVPVLDKFIAHHHSDGSNKPDSILINGKGKRALVKDPDSDEKSHTDREVFVVERNKRYRFRIVSNAITNCPFKISVDNHTMTIIASDGAHVEPRQTEILVIFGGERFDVVINADQPVGNYWVRFKGLADGKFVKELAILRYENAPVREPNESEVYDPSGVTVNPWNEKATDTITPIVQLNSTEKNDATSERVDVKYFIGMDFNKIDNYKFHHPTYYPILSVPRRGHLYSPQLNGVSFKFPSVPPLSQYDDMEEDLCTPESLGGSKRNCSQEFCECTHTINVKNGQVVELIIVDEGQTFDASHPMHLHGHYFRVVAQQKVSTKTTVDEIKAMDEAGNIKRKLDKPIKKDTVIVPDGGFTIIRFIADNPGWWLFHCHLEFHVEIGMSLVIHTGSQADIPPVPQAFPRCGSCSTCHTSAVTAATTCDKGPGNRLLLAKELLFFVIFFNIVKLLFS